MTADPGVSTGALEDALSEWIGQQKTRDFVALTRELQASITWKNAPKPEVLANFASLFLKLATISPNGVLLPKKVSAALQEVHRKAPINFSSMQIEHFGDFYSELLRATFSKFRNILNDSGARHRLFSKAGT